VARVVRVVPDVPAIDKEFDYLVPEKFGDQVRVGTRVRVTLHGRRVGAWVVADAVEPPAGVTLQSIAKVTGWGPSVEVIEVARWAARRWAGPLSLLLRAASPDTAVAGLPPHPAAVPPAAGPTNELGEEALARDRAVVRLPPAADAFGVVDAARRRGPVLVLTPSVGEAGLLALRLERGGASVALMPREWARAAGGGHTVVGARATAWAPTPDLAGVVVLDAHEEAYQEERTPTWNAWQVAAERARRAGVPCVLVSPCPTLEMLAWGPLVTPARTDERAGWPVVDVIDRRRDDPRTGMFSARLVTALRGEGRVVCVLNRTGRARLLACAACGELARCEVCAAAVEQVDEGLRCRRCGTERPAVCAACGSTRLKTLRAGVSRVREELEALAGAPVGEVSATSTDVPDTRVLVGTEAVLHRIPRADVVAFLDLDQELLAPRYRAAEQALALLARAARLVGGRRDGGRLLLQTRLPRHEVIDAVLHADPGRLVTVEGARRAALRFPPTTAMALVSGEAAPVFVARLPDTVERLGPDGGRWLVRAPDHSTLSNALAATARPPGRLRVEVDPLRV
jgi:primosomal protein N' (replication factor Y)